MELGRFSRRPSVPAPSEIEIETISDDRSNEQLRALSPIKRCPLCRSKLTQISDSEGHQAPADALLQVDYFSYHFEILNRLGLYLPPPLEGSKLDQLKYIIFVVLLLVIIMFSAARVKYIIFHESQALKVSIDLAHKLSRVFVLLSFMFTVTFRQEKLYKLLATINASLIGKPNLFSTIQVKKVVIFVAASSIFVSVVYRIFLLGVDVNEWSAREFVLQYSWEIADTFLYWKRDIDINGTDIRSQQIDEKFAQEVNTMTMVLAFIQATSAFCATAYEFIVKDAMLTASLTLYFECQALETDISELRFTHSRRLTANCWKQYAFAKKISNEMDELFGSLLSVLHVSSLLTGAKFLYQITHGNYKTGIVFVSAWSIAKVALTYKLLAKCTETNASFQNWIQQNLRSLSSVEIEGEDEPIQLMILLDELNKKPIGLHSSSFLVDANFNVQLFGTIISYFLQLVSATEDE